MAKQRQNKQTISRTTARADKYPKATKASTQHPSNATPLPLEFPPHLPYPTDDFLCNEAPYQKSFQTALTTSYEGVVVDQPKDLPVNEPKIQDSLQQMLEKDFFRQDVTQPFGLGTKCAKTYVTRCLLGEPGTTYKYLGLRMFAHPWKGDTIQSLATQLTERTKYHLKELDQTRQQRGAPITKGRPNYDICLINRMEASNDRKVEPSLGRGHTSVSWHADSSLEHYSTIAVYQTLTTEKDQPLKSHPWQVALRVAPNSEGPQASRRGTDIESSIVKETPPIAVTLPSGSAYFMLDDFNHHHQHTVLTKDDAADDTVRYSCTYRLLRDSHNVEYMIRRCQSTCSNFHRKGSKLWRSEQLLLSEVESEWIRQFYIQGQQHYDLLATSYWKEPLEQLLRYWGQLESRTKQVLDLLRAAAEGKCGLDDNSKVSKAERKARDRRKRSLATLQELLGRTAGNHSDALESMYEPFATLLEERAEMRELWSKREKDHVFHQLGPECRPMPVPIHFQRPQDEKPTMGSGSSPLPGTPEELRLFAKNLRAWGQAYDTGNKKDLPVVPNKATKPAAKEGETTPHSMAQEWSGWADKEFGLELQEPYAGAILEGRKTIETRLYDLPKGLLGKKIHIIQTPSGKAGVSAMGNEISLQSSAASIIGWCKIASVIKYTTKGSFEADEKSHLVSSDSGYGWKEGKTKVVYGWVVSEYGPTNGESKFDTATRRMRSLFQLTGVDATQRKKRQSKSRRSAASGKPKRRKRF